MGKSKNNYTELNGKTIFRSNLQDCDLFPIMQLVAKSAIFCPVSVFNAFIEEHKSHLLAPNTRRRRASEPRGKVGDIRYDDNTYPNTRLKDLIRRHCGVDFVSGTFNLCHIWQDTAYEVEYFSAIPNLVLLPRELASLSDYSQEICDLLAYRSFELYGWYPETLLPPERPERYDELIWFSHVGVDYTAQRRTEIRKKDLRERLFLWAKHSSSLVHKIIQILVDNGGIIDEAKLYQILQEYSRNPYGAVASLCSDAGNHYGKVLKKMDGKVKIINDYFILVSKLWKSKNRVVQNG